MLDQFWRSVDEHLKIVGAPDLVLLTGDLTFKGEPAEFDRLTKFLEKLLGRLPKSADGHPPLVVAVPGNHDLQRPSGRDALLYRVLRDFEKGPDDPDVGSLLKELWGEKPDASFLRPLFANYLAWFDGVIRPRAARPGVTLQTSFFPGDVYVKVALPGRFPLAIVGLNSAWMQYQSGDFEGKLALPLEQFHAALPHAKGESPTAVLDEAHRALLLMHHPRSWLSKPQRQLFDSGIYPGGRFVACLHGHMHEPDAINKSEAGGVARCYYQAPSLFGVEKYGSADESRAIGYTWATLRDDGELRAWPLKLKRKGDGVEVFDRDDFFHWDRDTGNVLLRPGDGRRVARPRASGGAHGGARKPASDDDSNPRVEIAEPAAILAYRAWVLQQKPGVKLIGVGGGNMSLDLEAVYVPLRARTREHLDGEETSRGASATVAGKSVPARGRGAAVKAGGMPDSRACEPVDFEVDRLFGHIDTPHALILGEPGSGKTTALHKLMHVCAREGAEGLGLPEGTLPVPLWLRRFSKARDGKSLAAWMQDELDERSGKKLPDDLGAALWAHGRLLLLADGLDEVADEGLRARLCGYLGEQLAGTPVRAVVSSRYAGYRRTVKLSEKFAELELRPLSGEQVDRLVRQWFTEAVRVGIGSVSEEEGQERSRELIAALHSPSYSTQRLKVMVSTPLLLTLLCVIVHQGRPMPRSRAEYYERCLEVLLLRWGQEHKRREPPLPIDKALAVLRPLAYTLQAAGDRDTRMRADLGRLVNQRLRQLGLDASKRPTEGSAEPVAVTGAAVVDWLQRDAGVLQEFAPEHLGFAHLGLQEFLAATHIVGERDTLLDELTGRLADPWWHEVARLVAAQRVAFLPLMRRVLARHLDQGELLDELLDEAPEADATPLLERLRAGGTPREVATLLRLVKRFAGDEHVRAAATELQADADAEVRALAAQVLKARTGDGKGQGAEVVLVFLRKQRPIAEAIERQLRACRVGVYRDAQGHLPDALDLQAELEAAEAAPCVLALCGQHGPPWAEDAARSVLDYFADAQRAIAWALLPGGDEAAWPDALGPVPVNDFETQCELI